MTAATGGQTAPWASVDREQELVDDWSGAAAHARRPDPAALNYLHPEATALIESLQPAGWQEQDGGHTLIFWLEEGRDEAAEQATLKALGRLGTLIAEPEPEGWDEAWKQYHTPHAVGRLYLRPPWFPARDDLLDVVVDPGQAFGTGGHATTRQCLAALHEISPGSLLDLGSGSGVVSLAALRLGFAPVWGIDNDPAAVEAALLNAAANDLAPEFWVGDVTDPANDLPAADVVVANLALQPILRLARRFAASGAGSGVPLPAHLLLAGLLVEQSDAAAAAFPAFRVAAQTVDDMWAMLHLVPRL
ncbi:MAG: 50S ribosomal protein L11 methyltransferase [Thermoleophilia bacterium]